MNPFKIVWLVISFTSLFPYFCLTFYLFYLCVLIRIIYSSSAFIHTPILSSEILGNPFGLLGAVNTRIPKYDLRMFAENYKVKNIGLCVFNSNWVETCFGKPALESIKKEAVICSGSTMGSYQSIVFYVKTMLKSMDSVKCWLKGIESDQGYQNYLFYNGHFNNAQGNATLFHQGEGVVNTIGALNGYRYVRTPLLLTLINLFILILEVIKIMHQNFKCKYE